MQRTLSKLVCAPLCTTLIAAGLIVADGLPSARTHAQAPIILRDLTIVRDRSIQSFDPAGVRLDDGSRITWDRIEAAEVDPQRQSSFDQMRLQMSLPLFRISRRLQTGDYLSLDEYCESLLPVLSDFPGSSAFNTNVAAAWSRIALGERERAVLPLLRAAVWQTDEPALAERLPGDRRIQLDAKTSILLDLLPVWFDAAAAQRTIRDDGEQLQQLAQQGATARIYLASLAIEAGQWELAGQAIDQLDARDPLQLQWQTLLRGALQLKRAGDGDATRLLRAQSGALPPMMNGIALYYLGSSEIDSEDPSIRAKAALQLLEVPAKLDQQAAELSAACIDRVLRSRALDDDPGGRQSLLRDLQQRFAHTHYGRMARHE